MTEDISALLHRQAGAHAIKQTAIAGGMRTLRAKAIEKMYTGKTTCEEVLRITGGLRGAKPQQFKTKIALSEEG